MSVLHPWKDIRPFQRHSLVLIVAGFVYAGIGFSYITAEPTESRRVSLVVAFKWLPAEAWGIVFIVVGLLAVISSRWPPISKTWGYTTMTGLSAGWAAFYAMGMIFYGAPLQNFSAVLSWGLIAFLWWAISGLINPDDVMDRPIIVEDSGEIINPKELM